MVPILLHLDLGRLGGSEDRCVGPVRQQAPFPRFVGQPMPVPAGAPRLGAHTDEVLAELGLTEAELTHLRATNTI